MAERVALAVDDAPANREFLERLLGGAKFRVYPAGSGAAALNIIQDLPALTLAVVDMKLPDMSGLHLIRHLRQRYPETLLVIATMYDERSLMEEAFNTGCNIFLVKPHGFMELFQRLMAQDAKDLFNGPKLVIDQFGPRTFKGTTQQMNSLR